MVRVENQLCRLLGIEYPVIQGGMAYISEGSLAAAVSAAGGLGIIAAAYQSPDWLRGEIKKVKVKTSNPFGVNLYMKDPHIEEIAQIIIDEKVPVVTTGAGDPSPYINKWKENDIIVIPVIPTPHAAQSMMKKGADAVIAEGMESGGHIGKITTMVLIPQVVDVVDIPVVAAGGIADGRGLAASFMLGACGVQIGTRFLAAKECVISLLYKEKVIAADPLSTIVTKDSLGLEVRQIKSSLTDKYQEVMKNGADKAALDQLLTGSLRKAVDGDEENGAFMAGQIASLIKKEQTVAEIIHEIWQEACCIGTIK